MQEIEYRSIEAFFETDWGWAAGLAGAMLALTMAAGSLLHPERKVAIGRWLAGEEGEETWSKSFVSLFDALFGERHLTFTCFLRSTVASLIAVAATWLLMGEAGALEVRLEAGLSLGAALVIALCVNVLADYISLLETRWILGQMHRLRSFWTQLALLMGDFLVSAAIIWAAIWLYVASPLHAGEIDSFAEILGVFSIFSVAFYSTFLTSVWTWAYILSTWVMRVFTRLKLGWLLDVEGKPVRILSFVVGLITFATALAASLPMQRDAHGVTLVDRGLCSVFKGPVCLDVAGLTETEKAKLELIFLGCVGSRTEECISRGIERWESKPEEAARLFRVTCNIGSARACFNLGFLSENGLGVMEDHEAAARLYRQGCDAGNAPGCTNLGVMQQHGRGMVVDLEAAARLYRQGCDGGNAWGCTNLGVMYAQGVGIDVDLGTAARLYRRGCQGGSAGGCTNLGVLYQQGLGVPQDHAVAAIFYRDGCGGGDARGCTSLGYLHLRGLGPPVDLQAAALLFRRGCEGGNAGGCTNLGVMHQQGVGMSVDLEAAANLYRRGCEGGNAGGCSNLAVMYAEGVGMTADLKAAARLFSEACSKGSKAACRWAEDVTR